MKKLLMIIAVATISIASVNAQDGKAKTADEVISTKTQKVEVSCGQCNFGLTGQGCSLAVRFDGKAYYVDGAKIEDYGDAHAHDGMCLTVKKGLAEGEVVNDRFVATKLDLVVIDEEDKK